MDMDPARFDNTKVSVQEIQQRGRGLVARQNIAADELIISAPVLVLSGIEYYLMRILPCIMHTFTWERPAAEGGPTAAIAFGLSSLCNHSESGANAEIKPNYADQSLDLIALASIEAGQEILILYKSVPFEPT